ncbi:hypothetical protein HPB52_019115 [Rhipicephalus sanguineus]|uniref:Uncharacterized protein n=1 Tax=Rhipicephalus sanguineus TaxID=34632 RepID=A0A9D4SSR7_RHISA|nr:hypothetical protein HPB52_019115 [Rhipicephalus sanguineus]
MTAGGLMGVFVSVSWLVPVKPFHPANPRAWFLKLDATLALNGLMAQPLMQANYAILLLHRHPAHSHRMISALLCSPVTAARTTHFGGATSSTFLHRRSVRSGHRDIYSVPDHDDKVQDASTSTDLSNTRRVPSKLSAEGTSRVPAILTSSPTSRKSSRHLAGVSLRDGCYIAYPGIGRRHVPSVFTLPLQRLHQPRPSPNTTCDQYHPQSLTQLKFEHRTNYGRTCQTPLLRLKRLRTICLVRLREKPTPATPAAEADISDAYLRPIPRTPPTEGPFTKTGAPTDPPTVSPPAAFHGIPPPEFLTGDMNQEECTLNAGIPFDTAQGSSTSARHAYLPRAVHLITTHTACGMVLRAQSFRVRQLLYPCQHAGRNKMLRLALRRHLRLHHYPPTTNVSGQVDPSLDDPQVTMPTYRHPRQRCARTGKTHRSSYSAIFGRRGFTVPFRIVPRTSPASAFMHPPSTLSAGTSASRAHSQHPVRYQSAPSSRRESHLGTTTAHFHPVLRPLHFSQCRPSECT